LKGGRKKWRKAENRLKISRRPVEQGTGQLAAEVKMKKNFRGTLETKWSRFTFTSAQQGAAARLT